VTLTMSGRLSVGQGFYELLCVREHFGVVFKQVHEPPGLLHVVKQVGIFGCQPQDGECLKPRFCCRRLDMVETIRKRRCSSFYFTKDTFDSIPISMWKHLKSVAVFIEDIHQVISVVDEKFDIIEPIASMKLG